MSSASNKKFVFFVVSFIFLLDIHAQTDKSDIELIKPGQANNYLILESEAHNIQYYKIDRAHTSYARQRDQDLKRSIVLYLDNGSCLRIDSLPRSEMTRIKGSLNSTPNHFAFVIKKRNIKPTQDKSHCQKGITYKKSIVRPGLSKVIDQYKKELNSRGQPDLLVHNLKEVLNLYPENIALKYHALYPFVCKEISELLRIARSLKNRGYLKIKHHPTYKNSFYYAKGTQIEFSKEAKDLINYVEMYGPMAAVTNAKVLDKTKKVAKAFGKKSSKAMSSLKKFLFRTAIASGALVEIGLVDLMAIPISMGNGNPNQENDDLSSRPEYFLAALSVEDQKEACTRLALYPEIESEFKIFLADLRDKYEKIQLGEIKKASILEEAKYVDSERFELVDRSEFHAQELERKSGVNTGN